MNKSKGGKKDKGEDKGKPIENTMDNKKTDNLVTSNIVDKDSEGKEESKNVSPVKESEQDKEIPGVKSESVDESKRTTGGLGKNPLDKIDPSGLQGLITRSKTDIKIGQELLYSKAVKLTLDDMNFVRDMAIAVKCEGNFSEGLRACIRIARKHYEDKIKELAAQRKASEAFDI